jgi:hypothetical protein
MLSLIEILLRVLGRLTGGNFYSSFNMTNALNTMHDEGVTTRASGFVFDDGEGPVGVYIIRYRALAEENIDGRWN